MNSMILSFVRNKNWLPRNDCSGIWHKCDKKIYRIDVKIGWNVRQGNSNRLRWNLIWDKYFELLEKRRNRDREKWIILCMCNDDNIVNTRMRLERNMNQLHFQQNLPVQWALSSRHLNWNCIDNICLWHFIDHMACRMPYK